MGLIGARARLAEVASSHTTVIRARSAGSDEGKEGHMSEYPSLVLLFRPVDSSVEESRCRPGGFQEVSQVTGERSRRARRSFQAVP
jgi:hypothetical protein